MLGAVFNKNKQTNEKYRFSDASPFLMEQRLLVTLHVNISFPLFDRCPSKVNMLNLSIKFWLSGRDPDRLLTREQLAVGRAFQKLLEEELVTCGALWRTVWSDEGRQLIVNLYGARLGPLMWPLLRQRTLRQLRAQGLGRLERDAVLKIARADLQALSDFLGPKRFLLGTRAATSVDCSLFGVLAQFFFAMPSSCFREWLDRDFRNLTAHCNLMKAELWPDWELCLRRKPQKDNHKVGSCSEAPNIRWLVLVGAALYRCYNKTYTFERESKAVLRIRRCRLQFWGLFIYKNCTEMKIKKEIVKDWKSKLKTTFVRSLCIQHRRNDIQYVGVTWRTAYLRDNENRSGHRVRI